ncbi:MAG: hypothetical protein J5530_03225 [Clostridia bacterium]|nr:hypothetical protein [Clostridia bacterium]
MKRFSTVFIAIFLAVLMATLNPIRTFAANSPDYISEVKVFIGDYSTAEAEGYTLLKIGNDPVDLNQNAGGGLGSKGEKAVYLGYKTTKNSKEAITDLALMNMKGGYDVAAYDALYEEYIKSQIIPLADEFVTMIEEFRTTYNGYNKSKPRAQYAKSLLDKLTDDDTGLTLGTLLLNQTKYEMGDEVYNALSDSQKKEHADLITVLAQSNGKATLTIANLLVRGCDPNETTWVERFEEITYDDLIEQTGMTPTDAKKQLAKLYDDDAQQILDMWDAFVSDLNGYDSALEKLEGLDLENARKELEKLKKDIKKLSKTEGNEELILEYVKAYDEYMAEYIETLSAIQTVCVYEFLQNEEYGDGTMLDFFLRPSDEVDTKELYALVASLTPGQQAGLSYVSLRELIAMTITDNAEYESAEYANMEEVSIYDGVDRGIYEPGGVALTSDARRAGVTEAMEDKSMFSPWTISMMAVTGIATVALAASAAGWIENAVKVSRINAEIAKTPLFEEYVDILGNATYEEELINIDAFNLDYKSGLESFTSASRLCKYMTIGLGIGVIILAGITTYMTWQDMKAYYNVEFSPIPHYMVDEKDIIGYNAKGEKIMLKNQSAYYKAVECNRGESAEFYSVLGNRSDMNGDVGRQWLALYSVKKDLMQPILASSLKAVVGSTGVPAGYTTGIHMFGTDAAFNLNSSLYDWNNDAPSVYVYYNVEDDAPTATGSNFTGGMLALAGGGGIALGAIVTALAMKTKRKKAANA